MKNKILIGLLVLSCASNSFAQQAEGDMVPLSYPTPLPYEEYKKLSAGAQLDADKKFAKEITAYYTQKATEEYAQDAVTFASPKIADVKISGFITERYLAFDSNIASDSRRISKLSQNDFNLSIYGLRQNSKTIEQNEILIAQNQKLIEQNEKIVALLIEIRNKK